MKSPREEAEHIMACCGVDDASTKPTAWRAVIAAIQAREREHAAEVARWLRSESDRHLNDGASAATQLLVMAARLTNGTWRADLAGLDAATPAATPAETPPIEDEVARLKSLIHLDRTGLALGLNKIQRIAKGFDWICEGRGPYEYDDKRYRMEVGSLIAQVMAVAREHLHASGDLADEAFHPRAEETDRMLAEDCGPAAPPTPSVPPAPVATPSNEPSACDKCGGRDGKVVTLDGRRAFACAHAWCYRFTFAPAARPAPLPLALCSCKPGECSLRSLGLVWSPSGARCRDNAPDAPATVPLHGETPATPGSAPASISADVIERIVIRWRSHAKRRTSDIGLDEALLGAVKDGFAAANVARQLGIPDDWQPTPQNVNALPAPLFRYIAGIETNADPGGMVRDNIRLRDENAALALALAEATKLLNTPEVIHFVRAVQLEAGRQRARWAIEHDAGKTDADWFWLIGFLAGKALHNPDGDAEKQLHRIVTVAAAAANWHAAKLGLTNMRPGIATPAEAE